MKKLIIKSISLMLIFVILSVTLCSCSDFLSQVKSFFKDEESDTIILPLTYPYGWTAGGYFICYEDAVESIHQEGWWIETYDELMVALDKLQSNGSTFKNIGILNYDGDEFDVKYCIVKRHSSHNELAEYQFGDDPFDRCLTDVSINTVIFFEDVTIDQLNYSYLRDYEHCIFNTIIKDAEVYRILPIEEMSYKKGVTSIPLSFGCYTDYRMCIYNKKTNVELFYLSHINPKEDMLSYLIYDVMSVVIGSIEYLDFNKQ